MELPITEIKTLYVFEILSNIIVEPDTETSLELYSFGTTGNEFQDLVLILNATKNFDENKTYQDFLFLEYTDLLDLPFWEFLEKQYYHLLEVDTYRSFRISLEEIPTFLQIAVVLESCLINYYKMLVVATPTKSTPTKQSLRLNSSSTLDNVATPTKSAPTKQSIGRMVRTPQENE